MATSQQWRHAGLLMAATLVVLFFASADAWNSCPDGYKNCNQWKHNCETCIKNDVNNCGDCNKKCKELPYTTVKCNNGQCEYTCNYGWANCDGNWWNGCETDVSNDVKNCGSCHNKCSCNLKGGEAICRNGKCEQQCKQGTKYDNYNKCCVRAN